MRKIILANVAEGTHAGNITKCANEAITKKYLLGKLTTDGKIAIAGENDTPIGVITDEAAGADEIVNVALLGSGDTLKMTAGGAITAGSIVVPAQGGKVRELPGEAGTYLQVGIALNSASSDGIVECVSCLPTQYVHA